jgi:uncharacterized protein (UPF0332 family)
VKAQTSAYLDKSRELLDEADAILRIDLYEAAGRTAYLTRFHAAQALIFETSGRIYKSHSGVHGEFRAVFDRVDALGTHHPHPDPPPSRGRECK